MERIGVTVGAESVQQLHGGQQGVVALATLASGHRVVVKATDASMVDLAAFESRLQAMDALADLEPMVCRPLPIDGRRWVRIEPGNGSAHLVVAYEFADGEAPVVGRPDDARRMGVVLARLHDAMRRVTVGSIPPVAALRSDAPADLPGGWQLLHGDVNAGNLRFDGDVVRVFDLDDCGLGPIEFDVANAVYMVMFDAVVRGPVDVYEHFRPAFLEGYRSIAPMSDDAVGELIDRRVGAVRGWLDDLSTAPIGIRTSSAEWLGTLRRFVDSYCRSSS